MVRAAMAKPKIEGTTIPATEDAPPAILIEVAVPVDLATNLQLAAGPNKTVGDQLVDIAVKFGQCDIHDARSMVVSGETRNELEQIMGKAIHDEEDLIELVRRTKALSVGGIHIGIPDDVIELLKARYYGPANGFDAKAEVKRLLETLFDRFRVQGV